MLTCIERVLSKEEVGQLRSQLSRADWQDGRATAGSLAKTAKHNQQLADGSELTQQLGQVILRKLGQHPLFISAALPSKIYPPKFNRYADGGSYDTHVDSALMQLPGSQAMLRSDLSVTLFLAEPEEYEGGELEIESAFGAQSVKLEAGDLVLYPSSSLHRVAPVTAGARIASFFWIESLVADEAQRSLLFDLDQTIQRLTPALPAGQAELLRLSGIYHNLLRLWARP